MPSPPWNFATLTRSSGNKLLGGNIQTVPTAYGGPADFTWAEYIHLNWSSGGYGGNGCYAYWVKPQIQNFRSRGGNCVRIPGTVLSVLRGNITQSQLNSNYTELLTDARALGVTLGLNMGTNNQDGYGGFSTGAWCAVVEDLWTNVLSNYQDVIAYVEPGTQETDATTGQPYAQGAAILSTIQTFLAANGYVTPLLLSQLSGNLPNWISAGANPDLWGVHPYPDFDGIPDTWQDILNWLNQNPMTTDTIAKPVLIEEFGLKNTTYQDKADFYTRILETMFGHPDVVGVLPWTGAGPGFDGDWGNLNIPTFPGAWTTDPTAWTDTVASTVFTNWGSANRDYRWPVSLNGSQSVTSTASDLNLNLTSAATDQPTVTNVSLGSKFLTVPVKARAYGTFSATGDAGTTYTMSLYSHNLGVDIRLLGSTTWTGNVTNQSFDFNGTISTLQTPYSVFVLRVQATGGSLTSGTITALSATEVIGDAPLGGGSGGGGRRRASLIGWKPSYILPAAAAIGILRNPKLTRRRALNPLTWR